MLESLVALAIFSMITSLLLSEIIHARRWQEKEWKKQEVLLVAKMAVQTRQSQLDLNGVAVRVERDSRHIRVLHNGEEVLYVEKE
nr:competence type IV pilus minor pilin ComGE [Streptococcus sp. zg-70]